MVFELPHRVVTAAQVLPADTQLRLRRLLVGGRCLQEGLKYFLQGFGMMGNGGEFLSPTSICVEQLTFQLGNVGVSERSRGPGSKATTVPPAPIATAKGVFLKETSLEGSFDKNSQIYDDVGGLVGGSKRKNLSGPLLEVASTYEGSGHKVIQSYDINATNINVENMSSGNPQDLNTSVSRVEPAKINADHTSVSRGEPATINADPSIYTGLGFLFKDQGNAEEAVEDPVDERMADVKATKNDDARVNQSRWNLRVLGGLSDPPSPGPEVDRACNTLRCVFGAWHKRRNTQSFFCWLHQQTNYRQVGIGISHIVCLTQVVNPQDAYRCSHDVYDSSERGHAVYTAWWVQRSKAHHKDLEAARDAISRVSESDYFDWKAGSRCAHWEWPQWYAHTIRDGLPVWWYEAPKQWRRPQDPPKIEPNVILLQTSSKSCVTESMLSLGKSYH
jgi:hypothetical protein